VTAPAESVEFAAESAARSTELRDAGRLPCLFAPAGSAVETFKALLDNLSLVLGHSQEG